MKLSQCISAVLIIPAVLGLVASCISNTDPHPTTHKLLLRDLFNGPDSPEPQPAPAPPAPTPAVQPSPGQAPPPPATSVQAPPVETPHDLHPVTGAVTHVVLVWLKTPGDAAIRKSIIDASKALVAIPGVVDVHAGSMLPSTRPVVDSTYDVGLVFTFTDAKAMQDYLANPMHVRLLNEVIKPNADHFKVFDFTNE
jgi:hypothetical protein